MVNRHTCGALDYNFFSKISAILLNSLTKWRFIIVHNCIYAFSDSNMTGMFVRKLTVRSSSRKRSLPTNFNTHDRCKYIFILNGCFSNNEYDCELLSNIAAKKEWVLLVNFNTESIVVYVMICKVCRRWLFAEQLHGHEMFTIICLCLPQSNE